LVHFELILVEGERQESSFSLLHVDIQFPQQHLLKRLSFLHHVFWVPLWSDDYRCVRLSGSSILIHCSSCLFLCQYHAVFIVMALWYSLKSGIVMLPALDFFAQNCFG
jgi:hypothetical protein